MVGALLRGRKCAIFLFKFRRCRSYPIFLPRLYTWFKSSWWAIYII